MHEEQDREGKIREAAAEFSGSYFRLESVG